MSTHDDNADDPTHRSDGTGAGAAQEPSQDRVQPAVAGDDERESREQIARTGEPKRDALGNGDGAS